MMDAREIRVVAHYIDGRLLKGTTLDFQPSKLIFHIQSSDGVVHEVCLDELKAVFFVRDLEGRTDYDERKGFFSQRDKGKKVLVEFFDGEVIFGYTLSYTIKGNGFFMIPGDPDSNNEKIFIVHSATKRTKIQTEPSKLRS